MAISNVEFMLLQLIAENQEISGYEIGKLVESRGYREWADIGSTSIYVGLDKLSKKKFVTFRLDTKKTGKGPLPKRFSLTKEGFETLKSQVLTALSAARERDRRFDLALAALPIVRPQEATHALGQRKVILHEAAARIIGKFEADGGSRLPLHVAALFEHPLSLIEAETKFVDGLIGSLIKKKGGK